MLVAGYGRLAGFREGTKNSKAWMNVFLDDLENPLDRLQLFVPEQLHNDVKSIQVGTNVRIDARIYMRSSKNGFSEMAGTLDAIAVKK